MKGERLKVKGILILLSIFNFQFSTCWAEDDHIVDGLASVAKVAGETRTIETVEDSVATQEEEIPLWKQKLYYGYNFDIYFHHDSRSDKKENGWSIALTPEIGWRLKERYYLGMRFGGSYQALAVERNHVARIVLALLAVGDADGDVLSLGRHYERARRETVDLVYVGILPRLKAVGKRTDAGKRQRD